jgi:hypothetical protein
MTVKTLIFAATPSLALLGDLEGERRFLVLGIDVSSEHDPVAELPPPPLEWPVAKLPQPLELPRAQRNDPRRQAHPRRFRK